MEDPSSWSDDTWSRLMNTAPSIIKAQQQQMREAATKRKRVRTEGTPVEDAPAEPPAKRRTNAVQPEAASGHDNALAAAGDTASCRVVAITQPASVLSAETGGFQKGHMAGLRAALGAGLQYISIGAKGSLLVHAVYAGATEAKAALSVRGIGQVRLLKGEALSEFWQQKEEEQQSHAAAKAKAELKWARKVAERASGKGGGKGGGGKGSGGKGDGGKGSKGSGVGKGSGGKGSGGKGSGGKGGKGSGVGKGGSEGGSHPRFFVAKNRLADKKSGSRELDKFN